VTVAQPTKPDTIEVYLDLEVGEAFARSLMSRVADGKPLHLAIHYEQSKWPDGEYTRTCSIKIGCPDEEGTRHDARVIDMTAEG
jgi:hypothetical protein